MIFPGHDIMATNVSKQATILCMLVEATRDFPGSVNRQLYSACFVLKCVGDMKVIMLPLNN